MSQESSTMDGTTSANANNNNKNFKKNYNNGSSFVKQNHYYQQSYNNQSAPAIQATQANTTTATTTTNNNTQESNKLDQVAIDKAAETKKNFIEEVKARKAALEQKRQLERQAKENAEREKIEKEKAEKEAADTEAAKAKAETETEPAADTKVLTFAEKLKLKKLQKQLEEDSNKKTDSNETANNESKDVEKQSVEVKADETSKDFDETIAEKTETQNENEIEIEANSTSVENNESNNIESTTNETENTANETTDEKTTETVPEIDLEGKMTMTKLLNRLEVVPSIDDIFEFNYPEGIEIPDSKYKKEKVKYVYGPTFLLQFKDNLNIIADPSWMESTGSKIVIPAAANRSNRSRDGSNKFGSRNNTNDFRKGDGDSRANSKRRSRRGGDDRRSNRSRRDRSERKGRNGRGGDENNTNNSKEDDKPKEEVAPFVPSANRWVPKSRAKKDETVEKKLAADGVTELYEKDVVERKMKSLLNKLTLEHFDAISVEILKLADLSKWEKECETLKIVIEQIFLKACDEPHWSSMYAKLCGKMVTDINKEIVDETFEGKTGPNLVLHFLVARCYTEFEKGWSDKLPTNEDGSPLAPEMMSDEYYQLAAAKRRGLGLVRFIGYLYRLNLLTAKMMFECFRRLMKDLNNEPSEEILESVVELLSTVGEQFENDSFSAGSATLEGSTLLDSLFVILQQLIDESDISNRIKFKLLDMVELREKSWTSNKKDAGPKTIQQIHEEDERERALKQQQQQSSRSNSRRSGHNNSTRNSSRRDNRDNRDNNNNNSPFIRDKDNFMTSRSFSQRSQRQQQQNKPQQPEPKEETNLHQSASTNMFSALMDNDDSDSDE